MNKWNHGNRSWATAISPSTLVFSSSIEFMPYQAHLILGNYGIAVLFASHPLTQSTFDLAIYFLVTCYVFFQLDNVTEKRGGGIYRQCSMGSLLHSLLLRRGPSGYFDAHDFFIIPLYHWNQDRRSTHACSSSLLVHNSGRRYVVLRYI